MRLESDLKPHNKETYEKLKGILQTNKKTCIIQPTGSGKSYLILKLIEDYTEQGRDIIVIEPQKYIFEQLQKNMRKYGLRSNVRFLTYSALGRMNDEKIQKYHSPKLVLVDEMHRAGAPKWNIGLKKMFETFPDNCKYIGFSATPIRFLDSKRNMADELFNGCIANEISLADAILNRILPLPRYIAGLYTYENEVNTIIRKIQNSHNTYREKKKLLEEVAVMKKNLDKSKGISSIFKEYINQDKGKYIAFCRDIDSHLKLMKSCLEQWFSEAGIACNFYEVHSKNPEKDDQFNAFMDDTELSVCLSVAMLSEGIHGIDGVILLRDTISPNLYYQQIGRVFAVDMDTVPIIFDLVANCESIMECNLKNDLLEAIDKRDKGKKNVDNNADSIASNVVEDNKNNEENEKEITKEIIENFFIFDQVIDAVNVFKNIELICKQNDFWTNEDKVFLAENYGLLSVKEIAKKLGKSMVAVEYMRKKLKLRNLYRFWSKREIEILKKYYPLEGNKVANRLPYKTEEQCQRKAKRLKINYSEQKVPKKYKYVHWSRYEQKWKVYFVVNGEFIYFGCFDSEDEAGRVAMEKAKEYGKAI